MFWTVKTLMGTSHGALHPQAAKSLLIGFGVTSDAEGVLKLRPCLLKDEGCPGQRSPGGTSC